MMGFAALYPSYACPASTGKSLLEIEADGLTAVVLAKAGTHTAESIGRRR
jgi:hypothetical protein